MGLCYSVTETQQLLIETLTTEEVVNGPVTCTYLSCFKSGTKKDAITLNSKQYLHFKNIKDGNITIVKGPGMFFLHPYERIEVAVTDAIALKPNEYVKVANSRTGEIRVERGESIVFLEPFESTMNGGVQPVHVIDETHAILIRDIRSAIQTLVVEPQMFVPTAFQEIVNSQDLIVLKEFEVMTLIDPKGNFMFKHGWIKQEASFFIPPFYTVLEHKWSKTSVRKALSEGNMKSAVLESYVEEHKFNRIDMRHRFMPYAFVVRTHDNVEIILDIVFGWQISDPEKMINKTKDATNDICLIARSEIIEKVAKQPFREFMQEVNAVVENAVLQADKKVYDERGIIVTSIQVEGFSCKHEETEKVLQETVQETTNKMNRVLKQETTNEVIRVEMEGRIREEELKKKVLEIQYEHEQITAKTDGDADAKRVHSFLTSLGDDLSLEQKIVIFNIMGKQESIKTLAQGTGVTLFCTPQDVNLNMSAFGSIDHRHDDMLKVMPPPAKGRRISPVTSNNLVNL